MFKKIAIKTGVLTTVFILAVIVSSYVTNRGNTDMSQIGRCDTAKNILYDRRIEAELTAGI